MGISAQLFRIVDTVIAAVAAAFAGGAAGSANDGCYAVGVAVDDYDDAAVEHHQ